MVKGAEGADAEGGDRWLIAQVEPDGLCEAMREIHCLRSKIVFSPLPPDRASQLPLFESDAAIAASDGLSFVLFEQLGDLA